jgi:hypothetical protein
LEVVSVWTIRGRSEDFETGEDVDDAEVIDSVEDASENRDEEVVDSESDSESEMSSSKSWRERERQVVVVSRVGSVMTDFADSSIGELRARTESSIALSFEAIGDSSLLSVWVWIFILEMAGAWIDSSDQIVTASPNSPTRTFRLFSITKMYSVFSPKARIHSDHATPDWRQAA